ncbi:hypothetical protein [Saccharothrix luteola]|nr:hypothetical protein [Saccharothrix luteola]MCC8249715.1 hypothetical protein [Saccharothrix luteola]
MNTNRTVGFFASRASDGRLTSTSFGFCGLTMPGSRSAIRCTTLSCDRS